jgi:arabinofuranosyltransferase
MRAAIVTVFLLASALVWDFTPVDDAFITYRYSRHLAAGEGLVFNPGERVEGYSSLSWALVLAAGDAVGLPPPDLSKILGIALGAGTLLLVAGRGSRFRLLAAALLAVWLPAVYHFQNGLETALAAFLVTVLVVLPPGRAHYLAAALLVLTRPEGLLAVLLWAFCSWATARGRPRHELAVTTAAGLTFAGQLVFRRLYYGEWIANSARAKLLPLSVALPRGLADLGQFAFEGAAYGLLLILVLAGLLVRRPDPDPDSRAALRFEAAFLILFGLALAASGGDSFPLWRFYIPLAPVLFLAAARGLNRLLGTLLRPTALVIPGLVLLATLLAPAPGFVRRIAVEASWRELWTTMGRTLGRTAPPATSIALCPVGALPYASGLKVIDMLGLTDPHIARVAPDRSYVYPGHQRHDGAYVLSRKPDLILLANGPVVAEPGPFPWDRVRPYERDLVADPRFRSGYRLVHLRLGPDAWLQIFAATRAPAGGASGRGPSPRSPAPGTGR